MLRLGGPIGRLRSRRAVRAGLREAGRHAARLDANAELDCRLRILERAPDHASSLKRVARLRQERGEPHRAEEAWRRLLSLRPDHVEAWDQLAYWLVQRMVAGRARRSTGTASAPRAHAVRKGPIRLPPGGRPGGRGRRAFIQVFT